MKNVISYIYIYMKNCCNHNKKDKVCKRKDGKEFNLPRRFTRKRCLKGHIKGFTMRSSCAPYKNCKSKSKTKKRKNQKGGSNPKKSSDMSTIGEETANAAKILMGLKKYSNNNNKNPDIPKSISTSNTGIQDSVSPLKTNGLNNGNKMTFDLPSDVKGGAIFWRDIKPDKKDYGKYKKSCFLLPKENKYPICDKKTKKMNCKGLLAAHNRAKLSIRRGLKNKTYSYKDITKKARKLAKTKKCSWLK